jgi:hypothetical protein
MTSEPFKYSLAAPNLSTDAMGKKSWSFRKTKNEHMASGWRSGKKPLVGLYVRIEFVCRLWEENRPVPWSDTNMPEGG